MDARPLSYDEIGSAVERAVQSQRALDIHTHLFSPEFGAHMLWGIDELLNYHYLIAETMRQSDIGINAFWKMSRPRQADHIWQTLFIENSPVSEACRGVLTALKTLGADPAERDLNRIREFFADSSADEMIDRAFKAANIGAVVMTNDPFDEEEARVWLKGRPPNERFLPALRIDPLLNDYEEQALPTLLAQGYNADAALSKECLGEVRAFLNDWIDRMDPLYMAVSLPPDFAYPEESTRGELIRQCVLPVSYFRGVPFALMIGVKRQVNPSLRMAGDGCAKADMSALENLCAENPDNAFLTTFLSRENQHELCVAARKFPNLLLFGCWWFMNNPSVVEEITRERVELLGLSFVPQHSDARILEQLAYKWPHARKTIGAVLAEKYRDLAASGWTPTVSEIERDVHNLFAGNFQRFLERAS